jgi:cell division protein FtsZ
MPIELDYTPTSGAKIRVVGVGGGGGNAINSMIKRGLDGVDFIAANTDQQALQANLAPVKVQIGKELTRGLGAGADPGIGQLAVEESVDDVREALANSDMVFVTAGMGGGTGTGGAPVIARVGRELDALVVGIVTRPFTWEARKRTHSAEHGISELRKQVDALIVIPNQKLMNIIDRNTSFVEAFQKVDDVLYNATKGIADIISGNGYVNVDFADVRTIMKNKGDALMGIGIARGDNRAVEAATSAINSPLLEGVSISGAEGVLINISANNTVSMIEIGEAVQTIEEAAGEQANLIFGVVFNEDLGDNMMVTVVATGYKQVSATGTVENTTQVAVPQPQVIAEPVAEPAVQVATAPVTPIQQQVIATPVHAQQPAQVIQPVVQPQIQEIPSVLVERQEVAEVVYQEAVCIEEVKIAANGGVAYMPEQFVVAHQQQSVQLHNQANHQYHQPRTIPGAAPIGHNETQKYDAPAHARRSYGSIPLNGANNSSNGTGSKGHNGSNHQSGNNPKGNGAHSTHQTPSHNASTQATKDKSPIEKPAFLRKIMD